MENYFAELNNINVNDKTEKKGNLTYLSWAYSWGELKKKHPDATYTIYENSAGWNYHSDGKTAWVKTGVTVNGIEHIEYLPIMDNRNNSIPLANIKSTDVNKAIQRSLTKAVARHGLGLYIYAGEDLPEFEETITEKEREVLKNLCAQKGLDVTTTFPQGLELTATQYTDALNKLKKLKDKDAKDNKESK